MLTADMNASAEESHIHQTEISGRAKTNFRSPIRGRTPQSAERRSNLASLRRPQLHTQSPKSNGG
jgi:hypothetical protein